MVEPVYPFQRRELDLLQVSPRSTFTDHFGLVKADDGFRQRIVVRVTDAANGRFDAGFGKPLGVPDRQVLRTAIAVMDQLIPFRHSFAHVLFQYTENQIGPRRTRGPPADDAPGEYVNHEGDIDKATPGRDVGEVRDPQLVRPLGVEVALHLIARTWQCRVRQRGFNRLATCRSPQSHPRHQAFNGATCDIPGFAVQLYPDFAGAVDLEVLQPDTLDLGQQHGVALRSRRQATRFAFSLGVKAISRRRDRQDFADRLDAVDLAVFVDERHHHFCRRSSSAWAKYAEALRRISLARLSSRFSRSSAFMRSRSLVVTPSRRPVSRSACRTQLVNV